MDIVFKNYKHEYYNLVINFLIELNKHDKLHINWNWARFEWMYYHPEFDKKNINKIGLWFESNKVVGLAVYDMYYGEGAILVLPSFEFLYQEILDYSYNNLSDENGFSFAVNDKDYNLLDLIYNNSLNKIDNKETLMAIKLNYNFEYNLNNEFKIEEFDFLDDPVNIQWLFFQGFDHGDNKDEFLKEVVDIKANRDHFNKKLSLVVKKNDEMIAYVSAWYIEGLDYAYLEPLCVIPKYRKMGLAKSLLYELFNRLKSMGASKLYVISDMEFYKKIGFVIEENYTFYNKNK